MQHMLTKGKLLDESGNLNEAGYAFSLVKEYDRKDIKAKKNRIKEWDYYYFGNHEYAIALTIDDNSYMDLCSATVFDYRKREYYEKSTIHLFSYGKRNLPPSSEIGNTTYKDKKVDFHFDNDGTSRHIYGTFKNFRNKEDLSFDFTVKQTTDKTMVIATPFMKERHFYYNQKINNLAVSGYFKLGNEKFNLNNATGVLDWGRGVWTRKNTWYWASLNDIQDGHYVGLNLGYGFGDTSKASENMFFLDEEAYKLEDIVFDIPKSSNGKDDYFSTWHIHSKDMKVNLTIRPLIVRKGGGNAIVINSKQRQVFGIYDGTIEVNDTKHTIMNLLGFAEKVYNRW